MPAWLIAQIDLHDVTRWKYYLDGHPNLRRQSTMQHVSSGAPIFTTALLHLDGYNPNLDTGLVLACFTYHDHPEGVKKRDVLARLKSDEKDLEEYQAFLEYFAPSARTPEALMKMKRAYLLQYAQNNPSIFPDEAREIMSWLSRCKELETHIFTALERWEYQFYAFEAERDGTHPYLFTWVLRDQVQHLQKYREIIPGFAEDIFCDKNLSFALKWLDEHKDVPELKL